MKRLLIIFIITIWTNSTFATLQNPDHVIIDNDIYFVYYSDLFKDHFRRDSILQNINRQIEYLDKLENPEAEEYVVRQVYGIWEIIDSRIYLIKITDGIIDIDLDEIIKEKEPNDKVFADWLTDTLFVSKGNVLVHGAKPIREYEIALVLENGEVINRTDYNNRILRESSFDINIEFIYQNIDWVMIPNFNDMPVAVYIEVQPDINGKLDFISKGSFAYALSEIITDIENPFIKEAIRIARLIPEWDVVIQRDKITPQLIMINFDQRLKEKYARQSH